MLLGSSLRLMLTTWSTDCFQSVASLASSEFCKKNQVNINIKISLRLDLGNVAASGSIINLVTAIILLIAAL